MKSLFWLMTCIWLSMLEPPHVRATPVVECNAAEGKNLRERRKMSVSEMRRLLEAAMPSIRESDHKGHFEPEVLMNTTQLITSKGYPCEDHHVITKDGYILNLQRIPHGAERVSHSNTAKPVVLLQHGLAESSSDFVSNLANESLPFILADAGADVWMGNWRGNHYSQKHKKLDPSDEKFWNWTFDEMARFDLPAMLDHIMKHTKSSHLYYVGHSQGSTAALIEWSRNPHLGKVIRHFYALAPATRLNYTGGLARELLDMDMVEDLMFIFEHMGHGSTDVSRHNFNYNAMLRRLCKDMGYRICRNRLFQLFGENKASFNTSRLPIYISHFPQPTSGKTVLHYFQMMSSGQFQNFDEGSAEANMERYGQPTPPPYNLTSFNVPTTVFYGGNDALVNMTDVEWLMTQIKTEAKFYIPHYNHIDFVWGKDAAKLVYRTIVKDIFKDWQ